MISLFRLFFIIMGCMFVGKFFNSQELALGLCLIILGLINYEK